MLNRLKRTSPLPPEAAERDHAVRRLAAAARTLAGTAGLVFCLFVFFAASVGIGIGLVVASTAPVAGIWLSRRRLRAERMTLGAAFRTVPFFATLFAGSLIAVVVLLCVDDPAEALAGPTVDVGALLLAIITLLLVMLHDHFPTTERLWISVLEGVLCVAAVLLGTVAAAHGTHESHWVGLAVIVFVVAAGVGFVLYECRLRQQGEPTLAIALTPEVADRLAEIGHPDVVATDLLDAASRLDPAVLRTLIGKP
jgi:MFS family permease